MTDIQKKMMERLKLSEADFKKPVQTDKERIKELEAALAELRKEAKK